MDDYRTSPLQMSTYWVLPLVSKANPEARAWRYFRWDKTPVKITSGPDTELNAQAQDLSSDFIGFMLAPPNEFQPPEGYQVDTGLTLFGAVAKTRVHNHQLPNMIPADKARHSVVIPVFRRTLRGVILIFSDADNRLVVTPDPEIKNSSGGNI